MQQDKIIKDNFEASKVEENDNLAANSSQYYIQASATSWLSPRSVAISSLEDHSIPNQPNRKIEVNRFTDLNKSATFSA